MDAAVLTSRVSLAANLINAATLGPGSFVCYLTRIITAVHFKKYASIYGVLGL